MFAVNTASEAATPKACPSCGKRYPADALFCSFDGAPLTTTPGAVAAAAATDAYVGHEISGHIEIKQLVGIGAMGKVYRAFQKGIDRDVAVKILHRELSANQALVQRFHREAKVASRLAHPNVVHVLLTGQLPDGAMYIVMEYLDGLSLQSALGAAGGAMPLPRALHIALQLCDAAGEAHAQGIVHRDLKPENVMLVKRSDDPDYVKVLDFGIARLNWGEQSMATAAGLIFGTARYISPEGAQGEKVGPQGDVYSIATIVYQMLAGRTPFDADQAVALLVQQIHDAPRPLKTIERAMYVPDPVARVVMDNLTKRPEGRAANARDFGRALLEAAVESGLSAQDILARPGMLLGGRGAHPSAVQLPPLQKTHQHVQLSPQEASRLAALDAPPGRETVRTQLRTAYETPSSSSTAGRTQIRTELGEAEAPVAPSAETTKWTPPADFEARLVPPPPPSGVDLTMDESQAVTAPPPRTSAPALPRSVSPTLATSGPVTVPPASRPSFSSVDTTMADEAADIAAARQPDSGRALLLVAICFVVGAVGMGGIAWKLGFLGHPPAHAGVVVAAATPTEEPAIVAPPAEAPPPPATVVAPIPPLAVDHAQPSSSATASVRATFDVSAAKPGVGAPVDFVGHLAGGKPAHVDGAHFHFTGPGVAGTDVSAADDGAGGYRASFMFLQAGRYQVDFLAKADGAPVRSSRALQVGDVRPTGGTPAPTADTPAPPAPTASAKWM